MMTLRGLGADCSANPSDPVCAAYYGTESLAQKYKSSIAQIATAQLQPAPSNPITDLLSTLTQPIISTPTTPGTTVTAVAATKPWYMTWWGIGLIAAGGFAAWKYSRPRAPSGVKPTVPAGGTAGLLGVPTNKRGMTYYAWIKAHGVKGGGNSSHYAAWKRGEHPGR